MNVAALLAILCAAVCAFLVAVEALRLLIASFRRWDARVRRYRRHRARVEVVQLLRASRRRRRARRKRR